MKDGLLKDLLQHKEPNEDFFENVFNICVGGSFYEKNLRLKLPQLIPEVLDELFLKVHKELQFQILESIIRIVHYSPYNIYIIQSTSSHSFLSVLLKIVKAIEYDNNDCLLDKVLQLISIVMGFNTTNEEMKEFFSTMYHLAKKDGNNYLQPRSKFIGMLKCLYQENEMMPTNFFDFEGLFSGFKLPVVASFPNSYTFTLWFRADSFVDPAQYSYSPCLFSFQAEDGVAVELAFVPSTTTQSSLKQAVSPRYRDTAHLVYRVTRLENQKKEKVEVQIDYVFSERCWYFLTITHVSSSMLRKSDLIVTINSNEIYKSPTIKYPNFSSNISIDKSFLASSNKPASSFAGQIASINMFKQSLEMEEVLFLFDKGFNFCLTSSSLLSPNNESNIAKKLLFAYHPNAIFNDNVILDTSSDLLLKYQNNLQSFDAEKIHPKNTTIITRNLISSSLVSIGGLDVVIPLFFYPIFCTDRPDVPGTPIISSNNSNASINSSMSTDGEDSQHNSDYYSYFDEGDEYLLNYKKKERSEMESNEEDENISNYYTYLFHLLVSITKFQPLFQLQIINRNGFKNISLLLQYHLNSKISVEFLEPLEKLIVLSECNPLLYKQIFRDFLFTFSLWSSASYHFQQCYFSMLSSYITSPHFLQNINFSPQGGGSIQIGTVNRNIYYSYTSITVEFFLGILHDYYWFDTPPYSLINEDELFYVSSYVLNLYKRANLTNSEVSTLRSYIIKFIKTILGKEFSRNDAKAVIYYILSCKEYSQVIDILLSLLESILASNISKTLILKQLEAAGSILPFLLFLSNEQELLRLISLKLISLLIQFNQKNSNSTNYTIISKTHKLCTEFNIYCFIYDTLKDFALTNSTYSTLLEISICPISYNILNTTTLLDNCKLTAQNPKFLSVLFALLPKASQETVHKILCDFIVILRNNNALMDVFLLDSYFISWITSLFIQLHSASTNQQFSNKPLPTSSPNIHSSGSSGSLPIIDGSGKKEKEVQPSPLRIDSGSKKMLNTNNSNHYAADFNDCVYDLLKIVFTYCFYHKDGWTAIELFDSTLCINFKLDPKSDKNYQYIFYSYLFSLIKSLDFTKAPYNTSLIISFLALFIDEYLFYFQEIYYKEKSNYSQEDRSYFSRKNRELISHILNLIFPILNSPSIQSINLDLSSSKKRTLYITTLRLILYAINTSDFEIQTPPKELEQLDLSFVRLSFLLSKLTKFSKFQLVNLWVLNHLLQLAQHFIQQFNISEFPHSFFKLVFEILHSCKSIFELWNCEFITSIKDLKEKSISPLLNVSVQANPSTPKRSKGANEQSLKDWTILEDSDDALRSEIILILCKDYNFIGQLKHAAFEFEHNLFQSLEMTLSRRRHTDKGDNPLMTTNTPGDLFCELSNIEKQATLHRKNWVITKIKVYRDIEYKWDSYYLYLIYNDRFPWLYSNKEVSWRLDLAEDHVRRRWKFRINYDYNNYSSNTVNDIYKIAHTQTPATPISTSENDELKSTKLEKKNQLLDDDEEFIAFSNQFHPVFIDEEVVLSVPCAQIIFTNEIKGKFHITNKAIYFFALDKSTIKNEQKDRRWTLQSIDRILRMKYTLRPTALEFYFTDRRSYFFTFRKKDRERVYSSIIRLFPSSSKLVEIANIYKSSFDLYKYYDLCSKWQNREISNFDYLMEINTLASRSINDMSQYPVFPWIISDYTSSTLDLSNPAIYRDLSKPIGAINEARFNASFRPKYEENDDPSIPRFYYGTHYSNSLYVLLFLMRIEPFTSYYRTMQDGGFGPSDRLFSRMDSTWLGCNISPQDVRELIPEFYYSSAFLVNSNHLNLGIDQDQQIVSDVVLPPWANTPNDFIRINREALESEYVSNHLHEWIDLIFGYKQRGEEAAAAKNVFLPHAYDHLVDFNDPHSKSANISQVLLYGQCPRQLFKKPHPPRNPLLHRTPPPRALNPNPLLPLSPPPPPSLSPPSSSSICEVPPLSLPSLDELSLMLNEQPIHLSGSGSINSNDDEEEGGGDEINRVVQFLEPNPNDRYHSSSHPHSHSPNQSPRRSPRRSPRQTTPIIPLLDLPPQNTITTHHDDDSISIPPPHTHYDNINDDDNNNSNDTSNNLLPINHYDGRNENDDQLKNITISNNDNNSNNNTKNDDHQQHHHNNNNNEDGEEDENHQRNEKEKATFSPPPMKRRVSRVGRTSLSRNSGKKMGKIIQTDDHKLSIYQPQSNKYRTAEDIFYINKDQIEAALDTLNLLSAPSTSDQNIPTPLSSSPSSSLTLPSSSSLPPTFSPSAPSISPHSHHSDNTRHHNERTINNNDDRNDNDDRNVVRKTSSLTQPIIDIPKIGVVSSPVIKNNNNNEENDTISGGNITPRSGNNGGGNITPRNHQRDFLAKRGHFILVKRLSLPSFTPDQVVMSDKHYVILSSRGQYLYQKFTYFYNNNNKWELVISENVDMLSLTLFPCCSQGSFHQLSSLRYAVDIQNNLLFSCQHWDNTIRISALKSPTTTLYTAYAHQSSVILVYLSENFDYLVSGDLDGLIVVWEIKPKRREMLIPLRFLSGGGKSKLKSLAFSSLLDIVVSGYIDGTIAIHTLHGGYFIRSLDLGVFKDGVDVLKISVDDAKVLAYSYSSTCVVIFDINGNVLCKKEFSYPVNCLTFNSNGKYVIAGGKKLVFLHSHDLSVYFEAEREEEINCISLSPKDETMILATFAASRNVEIYSLKEKFNFSQIDQANNISTFFELNYF